MPAQPRILIANPSLQPPGGQNGVAVAMIEALKDEVDLTLLEWDPHELGEVNRYYGSHLESTDFRVVRVAGSLAWLHRTLRVRGALWQRSIMLREIRRLSAGFDLVISVNGEIDVPRRALQYVHFPWGYWPWPAPDLRWFHRIPGILPAYYWCSGRIAPVSRERIALNRTLVNSNWTGRRFRELYAGETTTLYPPVRAAPRSTAWSERDNAFVVLGVLTPSKRVEIAVAILDRVRAAGHDVRLGIIGSPAEDWYLRKVRGLVDERREWARLDLNVPRAQLVELLARTRYGLHAMADEHFGMAVAEMTSCGCVAFVPNDGGQTEIVGNASELVYSSEDEAVRKISVVLLDEALQHRLQAALLDRTALFSYERFRDRLREVVWELLHSKHRHDGDAADGAVPRRLTTRIETS